MYPEAFNFVNTLLVAEQLFFTTKISAISPRKLFSFIIQKIYFLDESIRKNVMFNFENRSTVMQSARGERRSNVCSGVGCFHHTLLPVQGMPGALQSTARTSGRRPPREQTGRSVVDLECAQSCEQTHCQGVHKRSFSPKLNIFFYGYSDPINIFQILPRSNFRVDLHSKHFLFSMYQIYTFRMEESQTDQIGTVPEERIRCAVGAMIMFSK